MTLRVRTNVYLALIVIGLLLNYVFRCKCMFRSQLLKRYFSSDQIFKCQFYSTKSLWSWFGFLGLGNSFIFKQAPMEDINKQIGRGILTHCSTSKSSPFNNIDTTREIAARIIVKQTTSIHAGNPNQEIGAGLDSECITTITSLPNLLHLFRNWYNRWRTMRTTSIGDIRS